MYAMDLLLSRRSHLQVLRVLYHAEEPLSGREIERRTGLSNRATMMALETLSEAAAVHYQEEGNAYLFELNPDNYFVRKALKAAFDAEDLFWDDLRRTVRRVVRPRPTAAVATGPLARDESLSFGRIDLVLLFSSGRNRIRAFPSTETLTEEVFNRYGLPMECVLLDANTMNRDEYDSLWRRVEREGVLLFGTLE